MLEILSLGAHGDEVKYIQQMLNWRGFDLHEDGIFGHKTRRAVMQYQRSQGLVATGVVNGVTYSLLTSAHRIEEKLLLGFDSWTAEAADRHIANCPLHDLGAVLVETCATLNINSRYFLAHAVHESDWGWSNIAREKYNLFGFMAYDVDPYGSAKSYSSYKECLDEVGRYIVRHYLSSNGKYFHGATLNGMNVMYATDRWDEKDPLSWAEKIGRIWRSFL